MLFDICVDKINSLWFQKICFFWLQILETMPMTETVEELLQVIGPFYEIVEDKKSSRSSDLTSGGTILPHFWLDLTDTLCMH